ncbi:tetratricopeptide repeat-containing diguanylate cyclase [Thalassotalea sp. PP2-459]|uniref:tetratricopeptide repeat-containing diguanylate cyclase n=1 Tax=Thalassotalea sp. PP2-459 TaxID=1742724 RepID=UPI000942AD77|nr:tetratricopeptide repeat-containing diguanylate cyclase [Thalassotalea sp. PP2-459]OKY24880.1 hypothetical protein BI291_04780 [Thalassotalea sp. PP2-459]
MKDKFRIRIPSSILICLLLVIFTRVVVAKMEVGADQRHTKNDYVLMDEDIYRDPWSAYQTLLQHQPSEVEEQHYQWWLIRKAQSENLLYFYEKFEQTLTTLKPLLSEQNNPAINAYFYYFSGLIEQRKGNYKQARSLFNRGMTLAKGIELNQVYIRAKQELAYTYSLADLYDTSLKDLQEAFVEAFAMEDHFLIATINETYGAIYGYMSQYQKSIEYYQKALDTYERLGYQAHVAEAIYGLATTFRYWKKYDQAISLFKRYQKKVNYTPNEHLSYFSAYGLGMSFAEKGDCQQALSYIEQAFNLNGLDDYDAELYKRKASCHIQRGELEHAERSIESSEAIFATMPELTNTAWQLENQKIRGHLAFAREDYKQAYQLITSYYQAYSQVLINNSTSRVNNIRASLELERQEVEKALSKQRQKASTLANKNREQKALQQSYFIVFLITLLTIVTVVLTYQFKNNRRITALTRVDALTGLYNRRFCFESLEVLLAKTKVDKGAFTIILFDIDDFKAVNDVYGHPMGDQVLIEVAQIARESSRPGDIVARIGGEEFMCILPRTDNEQGVNVAERIRQNVAAFIFNDEKNQGLNITASFGVCTSTKPEVHAKTLYAMADKALYQAKLSGKNSVKDGSSNEL